jgi:hypothetical protein
MKVYDFRQPPCEDVQVPRRVGARKVVATMGFQVSFFDDRDPKFVLVRVGANEIAILVHGQVVIYFYTTPRTVEEEFYNIFAFRVVDWILVLVLRENLICD